MKIARDQFSIAKTTAKKNTKILLVANTGWYLYNFRLSLAQYLKACGTQVVFVSPWDEYVEKLQAEGFWWIELDLIRRSTNPFSEIYTIIRLILIYLVEKPSAVHHFTVKCVLYGTIAAQVIGVPCIVNAITGLGYIFLNKNLKGRVLRLLLQPLYRWVLRAKKSRVIFQNSDDLNMLKKFKLVDPELSVLIRSSGVDTQRFQPRPNSLDKPQTPVVLLAARMIADKGIYEYVEAVTLLKAKGCEAQFQIAGSLYPGNPSAIAEEQLQQWCTQGLVKWLGHMDQMENVIAPSSIVVLPSHGGEGVPKILLEAAAMGKPLVATDVPGCRDVVENGINGFLVPVKDAGKLAHAIENLLKDTKLCHRMGIAGREKVIKDFNVTDVIQQTAQVYENMGVFSLPSSIRENFRSLRQYQTR